MQAETHSAGFSFATGGPLSFQSGRLTSGSSEIVRLARLDACLSVSPAFALLLVLSLKLAFAVLDCGIPASEPFALTSLTTPLVV
jgi:hypothetical protein